MLISISLCHILPEANEMYSTPLKAVHEVEEKAELTARGENKNDDNEDEEEEVEESEEEGENHVEEEEYEKYEVHG